MRSTTCVSINEKKESKATRTEQRLITQLLFTFLHYIFFFIFLFIYLFFFVRLTLISYYAWDVKKVEKRKSQKRMREQPTKFIHFYFVENSHLQQTIKKERKEKNALTVFYRTPSLLYLYQSHWPWTLPILARHYATTTFYYFYYYHSKLRCSTKLLPPVKVAAKVVVQKKTGKPAWWLTWRKNLRESERENEISKNKYYNSYQKWHFFYWRLKRKKEKERKSERERELETHMSSL